MRLHIPDWKWACIAAAGLVGIATVVVFGINPGGFETQGVWLLVLLPASLIAYPLSDYFYRLAPHAEPVAFWILVLGLNFLWYWGVSYALIKTLKPKPPNGTDKEKAY